MPRRGHVCTRDDCSCPIGKARRGERGKAGVKLTVRVPADVADWLRAHGPRGVSGAVSEAVRKAMEGGSGKESPKRAKLPDRIYVYALRDPRDDSVRYVGQCLNPRVRLRQHRLDKAAGRKYVWIAELEHLRLRPVMEILDIATSLLDADTKEMAWCEKLRWDGLLNGNMRVVHQQPCGCRKCTRVERRKSPEAFAVGARITAGAF